MGARRLIADWLAGHPPANVWVGTTVEDQRRAEERIPHLLAIPARVRFLSVEPQLEAIDLAYAAFNGADSFGTMPGIDWVIVGGESGAGARPFHHDWARNLVAQCKAANVACFVKQLGANQIGAAGQNGTGRQNVKLMRPLDGKGGDMGCWQEDLRIRQFPTPRSAC